MLVDDIYYGDIWLISACGVGEVYDYPVKGCVCVGGNEMIST